jgi:hypothetical protein
MAGIDPPPAPPSDPLPLPPFAGGDSPVVEDVMLMAGEEVVPPEGYERLDPELTLPDPEDAQDAGSVPQGYHAFICVKVGGGLS